MLEKTKEKVAFNRRLYIILGVIAVLLVFNQVQLSMITGSLGIRYASFSGGDISNVDVNEIQSTADAVAALFPIQDVKAADDAIAILIPRGVPEYGSAMGVSFDDPIGSLGKMVAAYPALKSQAQKDQEIWNRYMNLASKPRGVSCEFCCGIGAIGVDAQGNSRCGCQHNPGAQTIALWLVMNTDYSDAEVLREVMKWKALWFPKNMVEIAMEIAGNGGKAPTNLPGMVGGC